MANVAKMHLRASNFTKKILGNMPQTPLAGLVIYHQLLSIVVPLLRRRGESDIQQACSFLSL